MNLKSWFLNMIGKLLDLKKDSTSLDSPQNTFHELVKTECFKRQLNYELVSAIITIESSWNPWCSRYEPKFMNIMAPERFYKFNRITEETETMSQRQSYGLMQIMGGTARGLGFAGPLPMLFDPTINIYWGCEYFEKNCMRYTELKNQISAYNAGTPKLRADHTYFNQSYVDKVFGVYSEISTGSVAQPSNQIPS